MALSCKQIFWLSSIICGGEITHPTHQWGVVAMEQILIHSTETCCRISSYRKQWMDLITTSSPTSFLSTPRTRTPTGRMLSNKHVSESSCKWPGVYVVLHRTTIFYICIWLWQMFWRNTFLLSVTWNTWFSSWFGQEHISHQLMPHHIVSSPECSVVTSHPGASCHIITVQHGPGCEADQTVTQHLWRQLHIQGWGGPGKEPLVLEEMVHFWKKFLY